MPRFDLGRLNAIDLDDVIAERRFDYRANISRTKGEHHLFELGNESAATPVPAEVSAELLGAGIHRLALGDLLEVAALPDLDEKRIYVRLRFRVCRRGRVWGDDDLSERDGRGALLKWERLCSERGQTSLVTLTGFASSSVRRTPLLEILLVLLDQRLRLSPGPESRFLSSARYSSSDWNCDRTCLI